MGNCLKKESTAEWEGEESEFLNPKPTPALPETESRRMRRCANKSKKVHFDAHVEVFGGGYQDVEMKESTEGGMEQVKIRITKKQLEELLGKIELESSSAHELLSCLIIQQHLRNKDDDQKPWRPVLNALPDFSDLD